MSQLFQTTFSRTSTASEVIDGVDLSGRREIVTGAGSGIGTETARALDLADQASVRDFVAARDQPLHILVNNAGIMALPDLERTREGWEMQFATNFPADYAGVAWYAVDQANAERLWDTALDLLPA
jgi:NAD(P)-dependent dehydrogenase (short-subunit alcohol dehydrogenase family)